MSHLRLFWRHAATTKLINGFAARTFTLILWQRGGVDGGCSALDFEGNLQRGSLHEGESHRAFVGIVYDGAESADVSSAGGDLRTGHWFFRGGAIELEFDQQARGSAEVFHSGNGFLAAVAALLQVDGTDVVATIDEVGGFVGDGALVEVGALLRFAGGDAQGGKRHQTGQWKLFGDRVELLAGDSDVSAACPTPSRR